ncbi:MAG: ComEC family competence protein [Pedosphaera sp.]|nr:ComEC family competence protein [Pedosphaera sp.]
MKRPLLPIALLFAGGIIAGEWIQPSLFLMLGVGLALLAVAGVAGHWSNGWGGGCLALACFLAGWINQLSEETPWDPEDLRLKTDTSAWAASIRGTVTESCVYYPADASRRGDGRTTLVASLEAWVTNGGRWEAVSGRVHWTVRGALQETPRIGDSIEGDGLLRVPTAAEIPGLFDYREFLRHQGIFHQFTVDSPREFRVLTPRGKRTIPLSDRFIPWAQHVLARGLPEGDENVRFLWAMVLGWKPGLQGAVAEPFMRSGTMHVFAISGLHVALIAGMLVHGLRLAGLSRAACGVIGLPPIWFYVFATGGQSSAVRSAVMTTVIVGTWALRRPTDLLNSLAGAALVVLSGQPGELFQAGFQLSFAVVGSLAVLHRPVEFVLTRCVQFDPLIPEELRPQWQQVTRRLWKNLAGHLATTLAAWLGSLPLVIHYFHIFNPVSLLANLVVVPLSSLALAAGALSLACGDWWPQLGEIFNASAWVWMVAMARASRGFANIPWGWAYQEAPPWIWWLPYVTVLLAWATGQFAIQRVRVRWLLLTTLYLVAAASATALHRRRWQLTLLPGFSGAFERPGNWGPMRIWNGGRESEVQHLLRPFLQTRGANRVAGWLLFAVDARHAGGLPGIVQQIPVAEIVVTSERGRSPVERHLAEVVATSATILRTPFENPRFFEWEFLEPAVNKTRPSRATLLLRRDISLVRIVACGPLSRETQSRLIDDSKAPLRADILIAETSPDGEFLSDGFLKAVDPQLVVVVSARRPAPERLRAEARDRILKHVWPVMFTEEDRTIQLMEFSDGIRVTGNNPKEIRWLRPRLPTANVQILSAEGH